MPTISKKNWTLMVYLAGDNNLDGAGVNDLEEMKTAGATGDVNVISRVCRCMVHSVVSRNLG